MRFRMLFLALTAVAAVGLGATGSIAASKHGLVEYQFRGELAATPPPNSASAARGRGRRQPRALRLMVGQPSGQSFAVDSNTEYLRWVHGVPTVVQQSNLAEGDQLVVRIRATARLDAATGRSSRRPRSSPITGRIPAAPARPLWLFQGTLNAPAASGHLGVHVLDGNHRALKAMLGQAQDQSFSYGRRTVFIKWQGRVPTLISPSQLTVGDRISVRIRARGNSSLGQVEATPANHVGEHEPASARRRHRGREAGARRRPARLRGSVCRRLRRGRPTERASRTSRSRARPRIRDRG